MEEVYCVLECIDPSIKKEVENQKRDEISNAMINDELLHFKQDGTSPHYARTIRDWLNKRFLQRWIGRRGPIEWPTSYNLSLILKLCDSSETRSSRALPLPTLLPCSSSLHENQKKNRTQMHVNLAVSVDSVYRFLFSNILSFDI